MEKRYTLDFTTAGVRQRGGWGNCHMDFLWFVNLFFYKIFSLTLTSWLEDQEKRKKGKENLIVIYLLLNH